MIYYYIDYQVYSGDELDDLPLLEYQDCLCIDDNYPVDQFWGRYGTFNKAGGWTPILYKEYPPEVKMAFLLRGLS